MIIEYTKKDLSKILFVINDAALKYRGAIPDDCWHEPYMLEKELIREFENGVRMFGYKKDNNGLDKRCKTNAILCHNTVNPHSSISIICS